MSLDGVMQAPGGVDEDRDGGFVHDGWTWPYWHDDMSAHFTEVTSRCDALLLGRKTWVTHGEAFEPMEAAGDPNNPFPGMRKYVVSNTLESTTLWRNSEIISGTNDEIVAEVRELKGLPGKDIFMDGSSQVVHTLAPHGLIDEYALLVYPVVLGEGKRVSPQARASIFSSWRPSRSRAE